METGKAVRKLETFNDLTGLRKAAIFFISLSEEQAAEIFKHLSMNEIEKISMEIAGLNAVNSKTIKSVVKEFYHLLKTKEFIAKGGLEFAQTILEKAFGINEAKELIEKTRAATQIRGFNTLKKADSGQLVNFLIKEHPQTIALILSHLPPDQTGEVLSEFPEDLRGDVAYRIATLGKISPQLLHDIEEVVDSLAETVISEDMSKTGGTKALAEILNKSNKVTERSILARMEELDPELASQVKGYMFVFEDIILIDDRGIQKILKQVDKKDLSLALKAADDNIKETIFRNMSERAAQLLKEDLEFLGAVRLKEVEEAQRRIIEVIKQLEDEGEIYVSGRGKEDDMVV
ncbi:MAG TPA: flagellar motor switch protein FliG [Caldithrix sp.]|nr:flagellar motor switch protein FliG [Caldithrix sp.]